MSREIVEAIKVLEQEKGLDSETLMAALEDALLSAYKKQPGAARYARVDLDHETADFRVFELILPPELEEKLLAEARTQYANGAPTPLPEEQSNAARYQERIGRLRQAVLLHERNIEALKTELASTR